MKEYISVNDITKAKTETPISFGPIGEDVYKRTYSRTKRDGTNEDWYETCARVVNGNCNLVAPHHIDKDEPQKLFKLLLNMELLPAGRHLWATGIGKDYLANCFSSDFTPDFAEHFRFTFMRLMEGGGVGSNYSNLFINSREGTKSWFVRSRVNLHVICHPTHKDYFLHEEIEHSEKKIYPSHYFFEEGDDKFQRKVDKQTYGFTGLQLKPYVTFKDFLSTKYDCGWDPSFPNGTIYLRVEDSREGWCEALNLLLSMQTDPSMNKKDLVIDVSNVRHRGAILKGFGGTASGPGALILLLSRVNRVLNSLYNQEIKSLDYMLIDHFIACAVVSGGTRRSSRMAMKYWKDEDIFDFIKCKSPESPDATSHWTTNISVVVDNKFFRALKRGDEWAIKVYDAVINGMYTNGEPGFINASKCLEGEPKGTVFFSTNPCGEISMVKYQDMLCFDNCCLGHGNLDRITHPVEAFRLMTRFLIRATFARVSDPRQLENVERNRRIGVGILGYHAWLVKNKIKYSDAPNNPDVKNFLRNIYNVIAETAREYCHNLRIPECVKKTTIAPTGTIGLVSGTTTGCQSVFSKYYIRRVRYGNNAPIIEKLKDSKHRCVPCQYAANTTVVDYVCVDPLYDQVFSICRQENLDKGLLEDDADFFAEEEANELIEDQYDLKLEDVLATQRMLQKEFADNAISITINVDPKQYTKEDFANILKHYLPDLKGLTVFPEFSMEQTPFERITKERLRDYEEAGYPIDRGQAEIKCSAVGCPIK